MTVLILGLVCLGPCRLAGQASRGNADLSAGMIGKFPEANFEQQAGKGPAPMGPSAYQSPVPDRIRLNGENPSTRDILYSNAYYIIQADSTNLIGIHDASGNPVITGICYSAAYGVEGNNSGPVIGAGANSMEVNPDEAARFSPGAAEIRSGAYNNSLMGNVVITGVSGNTIYFSPPLSAPLEEAYTPNRRILQITHQFNELELVSVSVEPDLNGNTAVIINGTTAVATVQIRLVCADGSPEINIAVNTTYLAPASLFYETIELISAQPVTEIYKKNRQREQLDLASDHWLDKQGVKFGSGSSCSTVYHTPEVSSLEYIHSTNTLRVNLDHMDDHHYRWLTATGTLAANRRYRDRNCSVYGWGDQRTNGFALTVGIDISVPRLMLNPDGYLATYVFTEHADGGTLATHKALAFGNSGISSVSGATGGFAYYGLPMTKSVFHVWKTGDSNVALTGHADSAEFGAFCDDLSQNGGFEICSHSPSYQSNSPAEVSSALAYMGPQFGLRTWIDHSADFNREDFSADGLDPASANYCKDLWEAHGVSYFWQYASEDNQILWENGAGDILRGAGDPGARTPLWWRHPTVTADFVTWASDLMASSVTYDAADWKAKLSAANLNELVNDGGVVVNHGYWVNAAGYSSFMTRTGTAPNYVYQLKSDFNDALSVLKSYNDAGCLNVSTVREMLDYWLALENVDLTFIDEATVIVTNYNAADIEGLALAIPTPTWLRIDGQIPEQKIVGSDTVFWFNLAGGASSTITLAEGPEISVDPIYLDFGVVPVGSSTMSQLTIHNTGSVDLNLSQAFFTGAVAYFELSEPFSSLVLPPGAQATFNVRFAPQQVGSITDTLVIVNDSRNQPLLKVRLMGIGESVPLQIPQNVVITVSGIDVHLSWDAVTQNIYNLPVTPDYYFVFSCHDPYGTFIYHGATPTLQYNFPLTALYQPRMFYRVVAYKYYGRGVFDPSAYGLVQGMREEEVSRLLP